jgi:hypothetical protein
MTVAARRTLLVAGLLAMLALPSPAVARAPAYQGYCGKQAKKFGGIVRSQNKTAGIYTYSRKDRTRGFWCFSKYKAWDYLAGGKLTVLGKPLYVPGKCLAFATFSSYWGSQMDMRVVPTKRTRGFWDFGGPNWTVFGPVGPGDPGSFNPHNAKAVKSPVFKLELLSNCVALAAFRDGGTGLGRMQLFEARRNWVPWFDAPNPTSDMTDEELGSVTATAPGDHAVALGWSELGVPHTKTYVDHGVASSF